MTGIYKITSPSGRVYIGQAVNIESRWKTYRQMNSKTKGQIRLWRSFEKHGVENHSFSVVEYCSVNDLNSLERKWQDFYRVTIGGLNCVLQKTDEKRRVLSKETRTKISESLIGNIVSEENKERLRIQMKGNTYNTGRVRAEWEKEKISQSMKIISGGQNNNMYGKFGEDNPNSKIIVNTETGIFYFGSKEASASANIPQWKLKKCLGNGRVNNTEFIYA